MAAADLDAPELEAVLDLLRARAGVDLSGYRRATLARRLRSRMIAARAPSGAAYVERLRTDPGEAARLIERLTIKVSRFWRNAAAVEAVSRALAADLARAPRRLRVWSAGCGRGEEAYTLAIVLAELGQEAADPPQVLATDLDAAALEVAAAAAYEDGVLTELPAPLRERYLARTAPGAGARFSVVEDVRRRVRLERHDLVAATAPPPGAPFDLVACRNVLIYLERALQRRVLPVLCEAVAPGGLLWLGEAEWPDVPTPGLRTVDRAARLFRRDDA